MVLDPLTALSVAGTIIQLVNFSGKLFSTTRRVYKSGSGNLAEHDDLEFITTSLNGIFVKLKRPLRPDDTPMCLTQSEQQLVDICEASSKITEDILKRLETLKLRDGFVLGGKNRGWDSFCKALRGMWKKHELEELQAKLKTFRETVQVLILSDLCILFRDRTEAVNAENSQRFDFLEDGTRTIIGALLDTRVAATKDLQDQTRAITAMLNNTELVIRESTDRTRQVLVDTLADRNHLQLPQFESEDSRIAVTKAVSITRDREENLQPLVETRIMEDLQFLAIGNRRQAITPKHQKTFEWVFQETSEGQRPWDNFADWLREGNGTYWINGKAGSGKSTLMRFIYESPQTQQDLQKWAGSTPFMSAGYFFWNSGTREQRSQAGLLCSLLHEVLSHRPALIPIILPWHWALGYSQAAEAVDQAYISLRKYSFSETRLLQAFKALVKLEI